MERDYIGNLEVLAAINRNTVSEQNLKVLGMKYDLTDSELQEMVQYCKDHGIHIYDEEKTAVRSDDAIAIKKKSLPPEEIERNKMALLITKHIMSIAASRALKRVNGRGWLCGTYTSAKEGTLEKYVKRAFSIEELRFITVHLPDVEANRRDGSFALTDPERPEMCEELNRKLNHLIPRLHVNPFYSDVFDN